MLPIPPLICGGLAWGSLGRTSESRRQQNERTAEQSEVGDQKPPYGSFPTPPGQQTYGPETGRQNGHDDEPSDHEVTSRCPVGTCQGRNGRP